MLINTYEEFSDRAAVVTIGNIYYNGNNISLSFYNFNSRFFKILKETFSI